MDGDAAVSGGSAEQRKGTAHVSKRRWAELQAVLITKYGDTADTRETLQRIADVLHFDPQAKTCTSERIQSINAWRTRKVAETGKSMYVVAGQQSYYQRQRAATSGVSE